jgi:hypothetical protein
MWDITMEDQAEKLEEKYSTPTELTRKAYAFKSEPQIQLVSRYEAASAEPTSEPPTTSTNTAPAVLAPLWPNAPETSAESENAN